MPWQQHHLADLFASEERIAFEETWSVYQNNIDAYCAPDASEGKVLYASRNQHTDLPRAYRAA